MLQYLSFQLLTLSAAMMFLSFILLIIKIVKEAKNEKL